MRNEERLESYYEKGQACVEILQDGLCMLYIYNYSEDDFKEMMREGYPWQFQSKEDKARKNLKVFYDRIKNESADEVYIEYHDHMRYLSLTMEIKSHLHNRRYISAAAELINFIDCGEYRQSRYLDNFKMLLREEFKDET